MQVDDLDACLAERRQKRRGKHVHPARQHNQLWPLILRQGQDLVGQRGVVLGARLGDLVLGLFALGQEPIADEVKVLPRDAYPVISMHIHSQQIDD